MARLIVRSANPGAQVIDLKLGTNRIGRGSENEFQIEHPTLSATHCELIWINDSVRVRDCGSTNGVFVNDEPVKDAVLQPGQILRLGSVELYVESTTAIISRLFGCPSGASAPPRTKAPTEIQVAAAIRSIVMT
jgi:pSer/pThr/pTyr-binding forkhead associated (FHA) protein